MKKRTQLVSNLASITIVACLCLTILAQPVWAAKMYKWVDADGKISYQDKPPPKSGKLIETAELQNSPPSSTSRAVNQGLTPVTAYTIANCDDCVRLMTFLKKAEVPVIELSLQDREIQSRILRLSGKIAAPTLFIGDSLVTDLSESGLSLKLKELGYALPENMDPIPAQATGQEADVQNDVTAPNTDSRTSIEKRIDEIRNRSSSKEAQKLE